MKDQPEDKFEQRLRERLQSLESDPPAGAWDRLMADLPAASPLGTRRWAALLVLLGTMIGGVLWWTVADQSNVQKEVALQPAVDSSRAAVSAVPDAKTSAELIEPDNLTKPSKPVSSLVDGSQQPPLEGPVNRNQNTAQSRRPTSPSRPAGDTKARTERDPLRSSETSSSTRSPSDLASPALANYPDKTTPHAKGSADGRTFAPAITSNQPTVVPELPEVTIVFPPSRLVSKFSLSPEPVPAPSRWELWATVNPLLLYQRVVPDVSDEIQVTALNRTTFSTDRLGLQVSAGGLYRLNERLALKIGAYYRYTRDQWTYDYRGNVTDSFDVVRINETTVEATPVYEELRGTVSQTDHEFGALLGVQYRLSNRWLGNVLGAELQAQSLAESPAWYAHLSYVAERRLSARWLIYGGPSFLWNFSGSGTRGDHFELKPYGFGAQAGVSYRLQFRR